MPAEIIYRPRTEPPPRDTFTHYDEKRSIVVSVMHRMDHVVSLCDIKNYMYTQLSEHVRKASSQELAEANGAPPAKVEEVKAEPIAPKFRDDLPVSNVIRQPVKPAGKKKSKPEATQSKLL